LSFQEYCLQRLQRQNPQYDDGDEYEEVWSESSDDLQYGNGDAYEEDDDEEIGVITENTECVDNGGRNMDAFGGVECADYGMNLGLDIEGNEQVYNVEEIVDHRVTGLHDMVEDDIEGMDVDFDAWLDKGLEFMQSFTDFGTFLDTPFE
jgi:predicted small metal-binding protein